MRDTLGRFDIGWRAVLAEVIVDGVRQGCWECADPQDTAARLVAVLDGIGLHTTVHGEDVPPEPRDRLGAPAGRARAGRAAARGPAAVRGALGARACMRPGSRSAPATSTPTATSIRPPSSRSWRRRARPGSASASPDAIVTHVAVGYLRPLGRDPVTVTCTLDAVGRASFRTRETVETDEGLAVEAATTLEVPGRALTDAEREELTR